ncbi:MAG TPA: AraC family transcriptional regulator [Sulfurovum sp.]|jgi:AraC family transcriptional regulator|nr:MAG: AraC family transcriptional regulator [Sulfurovum sp. 35-42-20]OYZ24956.1 MAG: AraC family transcriptional regulator [Sulfurovum sp. 16-42-52]OYZ48632.1 MAG: AraC family transcriptional regulator [Sulfurovum sp. 24-42-9]OZA44943.1 MAG: AraC family transcriptional regulator [Sulfurovum sp. 17-42-90]OZA59570.1 MAG: AraC family transcriptional regulator [Sulfurovum sp. 39-42-12]HQR73822.1 AraC family transcriptional regulator [Sulfurovum sp.]
MKRETMQKRVQIANDIMFYIYTHIETDINIDELSHDLSISKFHMHRIFKEVFGKNIYESIKSIRLQKASNLLLTNKFSTISEVANMCGYSSQTSFIRVFKDRFNMTPKEWKQGGYKLYSQHILEQSPKAVLSTATFDHIEPTIVDMPEFHSYYIRNRGYNVNMKHIWQKLQTWVFSNRITHFKQIALFHDNPTITPLSECQYVACIVPEDEQKIDSDRLPQFNVASGVYAKFDLKGEAGDLLKFTHWVYHEWLPQSEYETTTKPSYAIYHKNQYLTDGNDFDLSFYLSIAY